MGFCGDGGGAARAIAGEAYVTGVPGRVRGVPYPSQIWVGYGERRIVQAFGPAMGSPVGWPFFVRTLTGQPARAFGAGMGIPIVDALIWSRNLQNLRRSYCSSNN